MGVEPLNEKMKTIGQSSFLVVLLAYQKALLGMPTPGLRGAVVRQCFPIVESRFFYESVGEDELKIVSNVENRLVGFLPPILAVRFSVVTYPSPASMRGIERTGEWWVYLRKEDDWTGRRNMVFQFVGPSMAKNINI